MFNNWFGVDITRKITHPDELYGLVEFLMETYDLDSLLLRPLDDKEAWRLREALEERGEKGYFTHICYNTATRDGFVIGSEEKETPAEHMRYFTPALYYITDVDNLTLGDKVEELRVFNVMMVVFDAALWHFAELTNEYIAFPRYGDDTMEIIFTKWKEKEPIDTLLVAENNKITLEPKKWKEKRAKWTMQVRRRE